MTTSTGRAADTRRSGRVGQWLVGLLIVLAVVASVLMLFADQISVLGSLAVIAALWAAVIAAILVTRYRRQAESAESKSRDLRLVYELQLEREIAARRQYELDVESTIRKEISDEAGVELAELKAQVLALRSSLEMLLGESLPDQRAALPSEKLRELASGLGGLGAQPGHSDPQAGGYGSGAGYPGGYGQTDYTAHDDGAVAARDFEQTAPGAEHRRRDSRPFDAPRRFGSDVDPNEMTEVLPVIPGDAPISGRIATEVPLDDIRADEVAVEAVEDVAVEDVRAEEVEARAVDETLVAQPVQEFGVEEVVVDVVDEQPRAPYTSGFDETPPPAEPTSASPFSGGFYVPTAETAPAAETVEAPEHDTQAADAATSPAPESGDTDTPDATDTTAGRHETGDDGARAGYSGGRRRREEDDDHDAAHTAGLPVAELLNQLRQTSGGSGGGRRRRED
ncbi:MULTISPECIES: DUF6779 domain-containing protein [Gordonia]|uniref:DUF6779 domain-containing protein n=1 Tax=Gordonia sputi NBRC 100414 TaxID=1089453 RepID=H5U420_9ACTN|nr:MULTISPECIES: DUF6779 domain-containing protein [Gordonia]NKY92386.1 hypothetical protein [Gordonia sputi]OBA30048.1 hypothetical protein A5766_16040 [Gordonia sp. 852002-51296_SCH5728562-b]GAB40478.1 hypothetical protein GOSPT_103_00550 [Gordonia sputi NBRC 100414]